MTEQGNGGNALLDAALSYARRGWQVFPLFTPREDGTCDCPKQAACPDVGKHPRTAKGLNDATTDEATIRRWWRMWPSANVGLRTGAVSGFIVLDVDADKDGDEALRDLEATHGRLPETAEAVTGGGGRHVLFAHPGGKVRNSVRSLGAGLDLRGDGGYIVAAPSLHRSGKRYAWELSGDPADVALATVPGWLLAKISEAPSSNGHKPTDGAGEAISTGGRNATLASFAGTLRRRGAGREAILAALLAMNEAQCNPPLDETEVEKIVESILRYTPSEDAEKPATLDAARPVIERLRGAENATEALRQALDTETLGALAIAASEDRGAFEGLLFDLRAKGAKARDVDALSRAVKGEQRRRSRLRVLRPDEAAVLPKVRAVIEDAPVSEETVIPPGWRLGPSAVAKESTSRDEQGQTSTALVTVAPAPVLITGRLKDVSDGSESIRLAYLRDGRWQQHTAGRAVVANARSLVELAGVGMPVTSGTSGDLASYLAAFEAVNLAILPKAHVSRQMGWQGDEGKLGFLWGRTLIRPDGEQVAMVDIEQTSPEDWQEDWIAFHGEDGGDDQLADGYHAHGSLSHWREIVGVVAPYERALLALYAALVPPLLMPLGARNFAVDWSNMTSTGKTTVLRVGASCWGCPDERSPAAALSTWDASRVWIERASATLNGLPLILDDTKRARQTKLIAQTIYDVASGRGRGRGSLQGLRRVGTWQTVLLSSGEVPLTSFSEDGGTRARVLTAWGLPFGQPDGESAALVTRLNVGVQAHYGHAGPELVRYLLLHRDDWPEYRAEYAAIHQRYVDRANGVPVAARLAEAFAIIDLTAALAHAALELPWSYKDPVENLYDDLVAEAMEADRATAALLHALTWAQTNQPLFWGRHLEEGGKPKQPPGGWAGKWDDGNDWTAIAFVPHRLRTLLTEGGYDTEAVIRTWADRDWLSVTKGRKYDTTVRIHGESIHGILIKRSAFDLLDGDNGTQASVKGQK